MSWLYSRVLVEEYLGENFSDGEQSVPLNGNPIQQAYCSPDKMMEVSRLSRFGMTFKPLMASRGEELLMLFRAAFHVPISAQLEKERESMESIAECGEKWRGSFVKYDPDSSLWKTHQCSFLGDLDEFSETWPQWGLMRDGECWEQQTLAQTINATEFGLLPTPTMQGLNGGSNSRKAFNKIVQMWRTPDTGAGGTSGLLKEGKTHRENGQLIQIRLADQVGGKLNPMWVEWLMGWPLGWTDLNPLETGKSHYVQQPHGES